jgi:hypothetical protein
MDRQHETLARPPSELLLGADVTERSVAWLAVSPSDGSARAESMTSMDIVDEQSDQSFPASDPPSFSGLSL